MKFQLVSMLENLRDRISDWKEQLGTWFGLEGGHIYDGPARHKIPEGTRPKQVCKRYQKKHNPGEASSVTPVGVVRLQAHKKGWHQ